MGVVQQHEKVIEGTTYKTKTLSATEGLDLGQELGRLLAPGLLDRLLHNPEDDFDFGEFFDKPMQLGAMVLGSCSQAPAGELSRLAKQILRHTFVRVEAAESDVPLVTLFDSHFAGRYQHLVEVIGWALSVSFGGP